MNDEYNHIKSVWKNKKFLLKLAENCKKTTGVYPTFGELAEFVNWYFDKDAIKINPLYEEAEVTEKGISWFAEKTYSILLETVGGADKFAKMTPAQFKEWVALNIGGKEQAEKLRKMGQERMAAGSAAPSVAPSVAPSTAKSAGGKMSTVGKWAANTGVLSGGAMAGDWVGQKAAEMAGGGEATTLGSRVVGTYAGEAAAIDALNKARNRMGKAPTGYKPGLGSAFGFVAGEFLGSKIGGNWGGLGGALAGGVAGGVVDTAAGKMLEKSAPKIAAKIAGKTALKTVAKKIPILGAIVGAGLAADRAVGGDWEGAGMELASGIAGTFFGPGTVASLGLDAALAKRDYDSEMEKEEKEEKRLKTEQDLQYMKQKPALTGLDKALQKALGTTQRSSEPEKKTLTDNDFSILNRILGKKQLEEAAAGAFWKAVFGGADDLAIGVGKQLAKRTDELATAVNKPLVSTERNIPIAVKELPNPIEKKIIDDILAVKTETGLATKTDLTVKTKTDVATKAKTDPTVKTKTDVATKVKIPLKGKAKTPIREKPPKITVGRSSSAPPNQINLNDLISGNEFPSGERLTAKKRQATTFWTPTGQRQFITMPTIVYENKTPKSDVVAYLKKLLNERLSS